ncbi:phage tail tape measure protein [Kitasatospora sp. NPDC057965]|uniref:phage tail tape measure protein n=1 Tax=Kitasatospora sp. NPDC057965 TaxID=3346291 RepID=UPI0036D8B3EA
MADRTVTVRLGLDNSAARRNATQSEQDFRRVGQAASASAAEQESAFARAAASAQRSFEQTAAAARTSGRVTQESVASTTVGMERLSLATSEIPAAFRAAGASAAGSFGEIAASATGASEALARTGTTTVSMSASASDALARLAATGTGSLAEVAAAAPPAAAATRSVAAAADTVPATFRAAGAAATRSLGEVSASATAASQALARTGTAAVTLSTEASAALSRLAAVGRSSLTEVAAAAPPAAAATRGITVAAGEIPAAFAAASTAATGALSQITAAGTRSSLALAQASTAITASTVAAATSTLRVSQRAATAASELTGTLAAGSATAASSLAGITTASTMSSLAIGQVSTTLTSANLSAATGVERLGLASRIALTETAAAAGVVTAQAAAAQATLWGRAEMAVTGWAAAARASAASAASGMVAAAEHGEKAFGIMRTTGLLMLGAFAAASVTAAKFEKAMSGVRAVADASAEDMTRLRTAALEAGRQTVYSASQAAEAEAELAKAGVQVKEILGGALRGALSLAAAGQVDLAEAATISAQAMNTFSLKGKDVGHIADVLAAGANKSAADVHGLGESLRMGGLLAHQTGLSIEDTVGALSAFADHALIGSDAGTSLKVMLQRLVPQSDEALGVMQQLGFTAYDASGNFVGLTKLAGNLKSSFSDLTPEARNAAFATIFGSDAVRSATILYELGAEGVDQYRDAVNDQGAASRMAATQLDNLSGDLLALKGALEVALIETGTEANKTLREMVKWVTDVVNAYTNLPSWAQNSAAAILGLGGMLIFAAGGFMLLLPRIAAFQASLTTLAATMPRLTAAASATTSFLTGPWGAALGIAVAALTVFGLSTKGAKKETEDLTEAVKADGNAIGTSTKAWLAHRLEQDGALKAAEALGLNTSDLTDAILGNGSALERVNAHLASFRGAAGDATNVQLAAAGIGKDWSKSLDKVDGALSGLTPKINDSVAAAQREAAASDAAASSTAKLGGEAKITAQDIADTRTETEKLTDSLNSLNGGNISAMQAAIRVQESFAGLRKEVHDNGLALDITTEKGRKVKGAILDAASAAQAHAEAVQKQTGSTEQAMIVLGQDVDALKQVMKQAGFTKEQIDSLTSAYAQVPAAKQTQITDPGALQTIKDLQDVKAKVEDVPPGKSITIRAPSQDAIRDLQSIGLTVEHVPNSKDVKVTVPTSDAVSGSTRIQQLINSIQGRTVTVTVQTAYSAGLHRAGERPEEQANGSVRRAARGFTDRQAMVSRRPILWAEAGEEAYIPLSPGKRTRSMALLSEVAGIFGQQLIPAAPTGRDLIPARALASPAAPAAAAGRSRGDTTIILQGARQTSEEQLADLERRLDFIG